MQATGLFTVWESISRITRRSIRVSLWPDCAAAPPHRSHSQPAPKGCDQPLQSRHRATITPAKLSPCHILSAVVWSLSFCRAGTIGFGQKQNEAERTFLPQWLLSWLKVWDPEEATSSWPAAPHLRPSADQLPDWLAVCVSRGPQQQSSIQPEAGTAG